MAQPDFLSNCNVAILGLGLMGGSLALGLRGNCACFPAAIPTPLRWHWRSQWIVDRVADQPGRDAASS